MKCLNAWLQIKWCNRKQIIMIAIAQARVKNEQGWKSETAEQQEARLASRREQGEHGLGNS